MTRSRREAAFRFTIVGFLAWAAVGAAAPRASDPTRITAAANVTLREQPSPDAPAVAHVPLGTEVADVGPAGFDKTWVRVQLGDGREGWLLANLTKPINAARPTAAYDRIISERLGRKGDGFPALAELTAFVERVSPVYTDADRVRVDWARIRALALGVRLVPANGAERETYAAWLKSHADVLEYDEPGGRWMLRGQSIWDLDSRAGKMPVADDIAWFAVTNGLPGECEGFLPCYLAGTNRLEGEYLRRHPTGQHAEEAASAVKQTADLIAAPPKPYQAYEFDRARDCRGLMTNADALRAAVVGADVPSRPGALASLAALGKICQ